MTLSEWVQSQRIAALIAGGEPDADAPALECGNGLVLSVQAGRGRECYPRNDEGPWCAFDVRWLAGKLPAGWDGRTIAPVMPVSVLVALLKAAGWPRALGASTRCGEKVARTVPGKE